MSLMSLSWVAHVVCVEHMVCVVLTYTVMVTVVAEWLDVCAATVSGGPGVCGC